MNIDLMQVNLENMTTVELRKLAGQVGIKGMSSGRKADLLDKLYQMKVEIDNQRQAVVNPEPKAPKGRATKKRCAVCEIRPASPLTAEGQTCELCYEEAGWENAHSDHGHDDIDTYSLENTHFTEQAEVDAYIAETKQEMESCWICQPSLNKASGAKVRVGTPRLGMTFNVTIKADGATKATEVKALLKARGLSGAKITETDGGVMLELSKAGIVCVWSDSGKRIVTQVNGKNVRNVSEILQKLV
jgi:hypothetical protein